MALRLSGLQARSVLSQVWRNGFHTVIRQKRLIICQPIFRRAGGAGNAFDSGD